MNPLSKTGKIPNPLESQNLKINNTKNDSSFQDTFKALVSNVDHQLKEAGQMAEDFALGKSSSIHEVMIASEKAGLSLRFLMQIRSKLMEAYQEIMRMNF
jgi:flagellar hook-basal body complex protein FliE